MWSNGIHISSTELLLRLRFAAGLFDDLVFQSDEEIYPLVKLSSTKPGKRFSSFLHGRAIHEPIPKVTRLFEDILSFSARDLRDVVAFSRDEYVTMGFEKSSIFIEHESPAYSARSRFAGRPTD